MSNLERLNNTKQLVQKLEPDFNKLATIHGAVNFEREASFALQQLKNNDYLAGIAFKSPDSLKTSVLNVAAIGISLNPVHKQAYLVPRDNKVCLDISYRGYVQLAIDVGAIKWAKAEIVHEKDQFVYEGMGREPTHKFTPFGERGHIIGAYCVAKTHDGEYMVEMMAINDIHAIRNRSASWKAYQRDNKRINPWVTDEGEMIKKTVIKRAYKSWPMTDTSKNRLHEAIDISNQVDEIDFSSSPQPEESEQKNNESLQKIILLLEELGRTEEQFLSHLKRAYKREIKDFSELTDQEMTQAISMLEQFASAKREKEAGNENAG